MSQALPLIDFVHNGVAQPLNQKSGQGVVHPGERMRGLQEHELWDERMG